MARALDKRSTTAARSGLASCAWPERERGNPITSAAPSAKPRTAVAQLVAERLHLGPQPARRGASATPHHEHTSNKHVEHG
jgi:hypothetical protein